MYIYLSVLCFFSWGFFFLYITFFAISNWLNLILKHVIHFVFSCLLRWIFNYHLLCRKSQKYIHVFEIFGISGGHFHKEIPKLLPHRTKSNRLNSYANHSKNSTITNSSEIRFATQYTQNSKGKIQLIPTSFSSKIYVLLRQMLIHGLQLRIYFHTNCCIVLEQ